MPRWVTTRGPNRTMLQSAMAKAPIATAALPKKAGSMQLKGVVWTVYKYDSPEGSPIGRNPSAIYCDVILYGRYRGKLPKVQVASGGRGGLHEGRIDIPRKPTLDMEGGVLSDEPTGINYANLDGDHVVVAFLEDDIAQPYIARYLSHPRVDTGGAIDLTAEIGERMRLVDADGEPAYDKHRGSFYGVDKDGNFLVDLRKAHSGSYQPNGKEPTPLLTGVNGNFRLKLPKSSVVEIEIEDGATLKLEDKDGNAKLTLGDGAVSVAIAEHLETLWAAFETVFNTHTHATAALGPPVPPVPSAPSWNSAINSSKAKIPDG